MKKTLKNKILNSGLAGLLMLSNGCGFYRIPQKVLEQFNIPKKFENYSENKVISEMEFYLNDVRFSIYSYDVDKDNRADVIEVIAAPSENAIFYLFDINGNGKFDDKGIFFDEKMDGLNGNETRINLPKDFNSEII